MLDVAMEAARTAGRYLKANIGKVRNIESKQGEQRNLVSEIDRGSEARIIEIIRGRFPTHAVLAEESGGEHAPADYKWIIDPLDGTTNYIHGVPIYSVTIAVERRGELIAGVIYDPNDDEMFSVEKGAGAFLNGKAIRVSGTRRLDESLLVTGFPYDFATRPGKILEHFGKFVMAGQGIRRLGSAALDLAYIASGRLDGYWESVLNPWDMAAGVLLVQEGGGKVTDFTGAPSNIYVKHIVASNGKIHEAMLDVLGRSAPGEV